MSTPEPLDEHPAGGVEVRGGDRPEDFISDNVIYGKLPDVSGMSHTRNPDGSFCCDEDESE